MRRLRRELPALSFHLSRFRFGTIGPSNHFVEVQVVDEILDPQAAEVLGVAAGQLTLQYHAGGGQLTGQVGRLFAQRKKMSRSLGLTMAVGRPLAHLATARSLSQVRQRLALYFAEGCPAIPVQGAEGERVLLANAAAMNYGFAFRTATYGTLSSLARDIFGARDLRLVVDSPHNSIYEEQIGGQRAIVHRHNSCRAYPASMMPPGTAFGTVGPGPPGAGHASHLLLPLRGRGRSRTEPVLRLPRRRDADRPVRRLRPVRRGPAPPDIRCASATARTSPPKYRNSTTAAWTRRWRS